MQKKPVILVTGANGQLGKELQELCSSFPGFDFQFLAKDDLPVQQFEMVRTIFRALKPAFCINCAAYTAVDRAESEKDLAFQVNGEAVGVMAAICHEINCRFIHISTDYVFDGRSTTPYSEEDQVNPLSVYGASKLEGEKQALSLNPDSLVIRSSWIYSPYGINFVKTMLRLMEKQSTLRVVNDQVGSPTYARDLALLVLNLVGGKLKAQQEFPKGIFHYSSDAVISWYEFARAISELTALECEITPIPTTEYPTPAPRPPFSVLNKEKIIREWGIEIPKWRESLSHCLERLYKG